jgi:hypothetical protein
MTTAVFASTFVNADKAPSKSSGWMSRFMSALIESRVRTAARELRRHEAFLRDLDRRQEHSPVFLMQDKALPFKV